MKGRLLHFKKIRIRLILILVELLTECQTARIRMRRRVTRRFIRIKAICMTILSRFTDLLKYYGIFSECQAAWIKLRGPATRRLIRIQAISTCNLVALSRLSDNSYTFEFLDTETILENIATRTNSI
jgi:hypothetical protein